MKYAITVSWPTEVANSQVKTIVTAANPYQGVEKIRKIWKSLPTIESTKQKSQLISSIMPLHNPSGLRDVSQLLTMRQKIQSQADIFEPDGLPNIKLVLAPNDQLLLFDGHHSLLAYYLHGQKYLAMVPYLLMTGQNDEPLASSEISYFFPPAAKKTIEQNWQKYVVNWQADPEKQLEQRAVGTIGDLADQLSQRDERPAKQ